MLLPKVDRMREGAKIKVLNYWFVGYLQQGPTHESLPHFERHHWRRAEGNGLKD